MTALVVTTAFPPYAVGASITDPTAVVAILGGENTRNVVQTNVGSVPAISAPSISGLIAGGTSVVSGSYYNGTPSALSYSLDGGSLVSAASPSISAGIYSFNFTTPAAGSHMLTVTGAGSNSATSVSTSFVTANRNASGATIVSGAINSLGHTIVTLSDGSQVDLGVLTQASPVIATITGTAPSGTVGAPYSYTFAAAGFVGAITASNSGALPVGLALSVSGSTIILSGTPTAAATSSFTIHGVGATSGTADSAAQSVTIVAAGSISTRARFAQDTATAGASGTAAALFALMTQVSGASSDRTGTMTTTADPTKYTWVAVTAAAAGAGMRFFDGTGYGGFNGAGAASIYTGPDADPTTIHQTYTDGSGTVWNLYRSSGHSVALTFTLS